ncbi:hypothetical protein ACFWV1_23615, partial [Streptomyces sp. NPDC058700]
MPAWASVFAAAGAPAHFVPVRGECLPQIVVDVPRRDMVAHGGVVVARGTGSSSTGRPPSRRPVGHPW